MSKDPIHDTEQLCKAYALEFKDCGNGHVQLSGHGNLVNYWPLSKKRTAHPKGGEPVRHCKPWDAVRLCLHGAKASLRVKGTSKIKNQANFDIKPYHTNPAGIKHFYEGKRPPWEGKGFICAADDLMRIVAHRLETGGAIDGELMESALNQSAHHPLEANQ